MTAGVVCISRTTGAGGETVGRQLAEELGYRYVDEEIVAAAAERGGVDVDYVADAEERQSLVARLLAGLVHGAPEVDVTNVRSAREEHRGLIRAVVDEVWAEGNAVIVAHAASYALAGRDGVLRVLVTASPETRARRLVAEGATEEGRAERFVRDADASRTDYLKRFYDVEQELPAHYDLVVNLDALTPQDAVAVIVCLAGRAGSAA